MHLINQILFSKFPFEIGVKALGTSKLKFRRRVNSWRQVQKYVDRYNGLYHIYVSVYPLDYFINKIVFDIDSENLEESIIVAKALYDVLTNEGVKTIVVFSGRRGFHVYALFKTVKFPDENTSDIVIKSVFDYFYLKLDEDLRRKVDSHVKNVHAMIRLPGTLHPETCKYCTPVPRDFDTWTARELLEYATSFHDIHELELIGEYKDIRNYVNIVNHLEYEYEDVPEFGIRWKGNISDVDRFLLYLVRPCVVYHAHCPDATHFIRTTLAVELSWLDFTPEEQVKIFEKLGWSDFDYSLSLYHARIVWEKVHGLRGTRRLFPPSCKTLQREGYCLGRKCPYYPSYFYWWGVIG